MIFMVAYLILQALWFIAPAYAANAFPPILKGRIPLDAGKKIGSDRIFGNGKTLEGTFGGILFGIFIGLMQIYGQPYIPVEWGLGLLAMTLPLVILLSAGALFGDIAGSFFKRRAGIKSGDSAPLLDQEGFVIMAVIFGALVFVPRLETFLMVLVLTPPIHWLSNIFGYIIKLKKHPW